MNKTETEVIIEGNLELEEDFKTDKNLIVKGNIFGKYGQRWNINAWNIDAGNIDARNINARNINAWNINAWNINARDIDAWNINAMDIDALNIDAGNIICESRKKKTASSKTLARIYIQNKSKIKRKEHD